MKENNENIEFEEVLENEIEDIWDIFFPYMNEQKENHAKILSGDKSKPRRYLRFLTM